MSRPTHTRKARRNKLPTMDLVYWDIPAADRWAAGGPVIGACFDRARQVTIWAKSPEQVAAFLAWLMEQVDACEARRRQEGSLEGRFDFDEMGLSAARIDGSLFMRVEGRFIGLMLQGADEHAYEPFMSVLVKAAVDKSRREAARAVN